ncbi:sn-glycerol-3-phosphate ABC transporter ATP-binding protein UgpC [Parvularcula flava]|uniref:ABC transporter ATP-binding protein n=1 Tax=Aquisalinus luteolus TaxID=1566827 RepID=A0A8J3A7U4_9PROT|nr:sn-glycerol-3-phosphate ABC transporter ATP-binding protein UgpC [Aquisalinus luteolus]NHK27914.1 sn-glycerol-3-phosphate ABC transporter ATP-binding protein UgpC [Aquisalinus luteolus]GGH96891.1 ABC transporter ATP-binding protein [Aquisalinus luteolus]
MSGVRLSRISKRFGDVTVIDQVSLDIEAGEFVVFLGPSGCGKSTILRMIAGLETVDDGEIHIGERRVDHLKPGERGVAMVFQNYALYPHMTVRDNLAFGLKNVGTDKQVISKRIDEAAQSLEITALLDRRPGQLSGGQRQRVAIARAIVKEPALFLFDEPLSNLDAALRGRTRLELAQLHQRLGATMVFVTHDQVEAMTLADRIVVLNECKIEQIGSPMEIYRRPATQFVATFVGSPRINLLPVTVNAGTDDKAAIALPNGEQLLTAIPMAKLPEGESFTVGIRPEHARIAEDGVGEVTGTAEVVERLGERCLIYLDLGNGHKLTAEDRGGSTVKAGDTCTVKVKSSRAHLFDSTGKGWHAEGE